MPQRIIAVLLIVFALCGIQLASAANNEQVIELTVAKGDYLINLGKAYLEDPGQWREVARINRLRNPDFIKPGQKLIIPVRLLRGIPQDGAVTFLRGEVAQRLAGEEQWTPVSLNDPVREGSSIKTSDESAAEITFADDSTFFLKPQTTLTVTAARKKGAAHMFHSLLLSTGKILTRIKRAAGVDTRHEIEAPSAVAVVRGTEFRLSVDENDATRSEVLEGLVGIDAMKQEVKLREGEGTLVRKGEPPLKPRKLLPPPVPVNIRPLYKNLPAGFDLQQVDGAAAYRVALALDNTIKDVVREVTVNPGEPVSFDGMADGLYHVQSLSIDDVGIEGTPLEPVPVTIRVNPLPPFIQSPVDGAEYRERAVTLEWLRVKDAASYHLQIAEDRDFTVLIEDKADIRDVRSTTKSLDFKTYFFRVASIAADDFEGDWSDTIQFTIVPPPPTPPMEKPALDEKEVRLRWRNVGEGISYHFQLAGDEKFQTVLVDRTVDKPEIILPKPDKAGLYYARASAIDAKGYEGAFSEPQILEIQKPFPYGVLGIIIVLIVLAL
ncbi:MAG: FecR domain-containing protein [Nitrospirota bacterium]|nr:FecR domain-containing protein [Nitrospirota bacterium]